MKTEHRLAEALKEMMSGTPLDEISVTMLVRKCKVNRQTFVGQSLGDAPHYLSHILRPEIRAGIVYTSRSVGGDARHSA